MSPEQPQRPIKPIKYGDVFPVFGKLASKPISSQDAALMQAAETRLLGQTKPGGPAQVMLSAATINQRAGRDNRIIRGEGVTVTETNVAGARIITESISGQVVGEFSAPPQLQAAEPVKLAITIGTALEAAAITAGDKPVEQSDAAAIQAAQVSATGANVIVSGGIADEAQSAATVNAMLNQDDAKIKLGDMLANASLKLLNSEKEVTVDDAERAVVAELRNNPEVAIHPGGVADSMAAAARSNLQGGINIDMAMGDSNYPAST